ncbi:MAG: PEP-CTERM sorting domain-containing protein [Phycisphaerales bacterium]|nr:PEP-CTERM sorting domain-containing protein [Phycisphaerales bacterium]
MPRTAIATLTLSALAACALANPVDGRYFDRPDGCDPHGPRIAFEELGTGPLFPFDERIEAVSTFTQSPACPMDDDPSMINALVVMTNLTTTTWRDLFYVGDIQTTFSNIDGIASTDEAPPPGSLATLAFRIDSVGMNRPLVFESIVADGLFQPGETWHFIIQDYANTLGLPPSLMGSLDFSGGSVGDLDSSGSIVQFLVPAPGSAGLLLAAAGLTSARRRR